MEIRLSIPKLNKENQIAIALLVIKTFLNSSGTITVGDTLDNIFAVAAAALFMYSIINKRYSIKIFLIYGFIILLSLYSAMKIGNVGWLITIITCLAIQKEDIEKVVRFLFQCEVIMFIFTVCMGILFSMMGQYSLISSISGVSRFNMGFSHPNVFALYFMNILAMWLWLHYEAVKTKHIVGILILSVIVYLMSRSAGSFIATLLLCVLVLFAKNIQGSRNLLSVAAQIITPVCALFTWVTAMLYLKGNELVYVLNRLFSTRIKLNAYALYKFGFTWFGRDLNDFHITWDAAWGLTNFTFDNIYAYFFSNIGLVWLILICVMFWMLAKRGDTRVNVCIIFWAVYGIAEVHGISCYQLFPIILVTMLLHRNPALEGAAYQDPNRRDREKPRQIRTHIRL